MINEPENWKHLPAHLGDRVKIRTAAETEAAGIAGRSGVVHGTTTVSVAGVEIIGSPTDDVALNIASTNRRRLSGSPRVSLNSSITMRAPQSLSMAFQRSGPATSLETGLIPRDAFRPRNGSNG